MRFALVTETFPPEINGVAMSLQRILRQLRAAGHEVLVVRPRQKVDDVPEAVREFNDVLVPGLPLWGYEGLRMGLPWYLRVRRGLEAFQPDAVYVATEGPLGLAAIVAARRLKRTVVTGYHTNFQQYMRHYRLGFLTRAADWFLRKVHNATAATFAPSEDLIADLESRGYRNVRKLGRGVDTVLFDPVRRDPALRAEWGADDQTVVFFYVGRVAGEKDLDLFFEGAERLRKKDGVKLKVVVVGDGPDLARLRKAHPEAFFSGAKRGEDLGGHVASGDLFFFPSRTETFGNVVTEALSSGLLVIAYDYAAPGKFIVDGVSGFKARFGDSGALFAALERAWEAREQWPTIREEARRTVLPVAWALVVEEFLRELETLG